MSNSFTFNGNKALQNSCERAAHFLIGDSAKNFANSNERSCWVRGIDTKNASAWAHNKTLNSTEVLSFKRSW
jgi:hypothetical protein